MNNSGEKNNEYIQVKRTCMTKSRRLSDAVMSCGPNVGSAREKRVPH